LKKTIPETAQAAVELELYRFPNLHDLIVTVSDDLDLDGIGRKHAFIVTIVHYVGGAAVPERFNFIATSVCSREECESFESLLWKRDGTFMFAGEQYDMHVAVFTYADYVRMKWNTIYQIKVPFTEKPLCAFNISQAGTQLQYIEVPVDTAAF
jgi:hypothetical protein